VFECLKKDITIKNVVIVGEKISSVGAVNQLVTFSLHGNLEESFGPQKSHCQPKYGQSV
jgi:hypothetical protein